MNRQEANLEILAMLHNLVMDYPDLRFNQILLNYNVTKFNEDLFYEESEDTLKAMKQIEGFDRS